MKTIKISVRDKIAVNMSNIPYTCGNSDFVINFDFDAEWDEFSVKTARFIKDDRTYQNQVFQGNKCPIPVLYNTNKIRVGVFAGNLHTSTPAIIPANKGILCVGGSPEAPSEDVYAQIMEMLNNSGAVGGGGGLVVVYDTGDGTANYSPDEIKEFFRSGKDVVFFGDEVDDAIVYQLRFLDPGTVIFEATAGSSETTIYYRHIYVQQDKRIFYGRDDVPKNGELEFYTEDGGSAKIANQPDPDSPVWSELPAARLGFGMNKATAPVPFVVDGQLLVNGTVISRNMADNNHSDFDRNRWGMHVYEAYSTDDWARLTMLLDKHTDPETGRKMAEIYYYVQASHNESSYGPVKIGSDVALHSFDFSRDKFVANGEIIGKMPITLARISLTDDIDNTYETVAEVDAAYEPENYPDANIRCLKYIALKNAKDGAMFYDTDRNRLVAKINTKWCDIPFEAIKDDRYEIFGQGGNEVYCTSVTLDKTEITLTNTNPATLTPTILPENTTETPVWKSSDNHVATVSNGVITPIASGSAVITITVGSQMASCTVTVDIAHAANELLYERDCVNNVVSTNSIGILYNNPGATTTETGNAITGHTQYLVVYHNSNNILYGRAFEFDVASSEYKSADKLLSFGDNNHALKWTGSKWEFYGTKADGSTGAGSDCTITDANYFGGKTVRVEIDAGGHVTIYANGEHVLTSTVTVPNIKEFRIGGHSGGSFNKIVISKIRVYG